MEEIELITTEKRIGHYGEVGRARANELYKRYSKWMGENKPNIVPMKFKEWINWAQKKGIVKVYYADSASNNNNTERSNIDTSGVTYEISKIGKIVAWTIIGVTAISLTIYLLRSAMPKPITASTPAI